MSFQEGQVSNSRMFSSSEWIRVRRQSSPKWARTINFAYEQSSTTRTLTRKTCSSIWYVAKSIFCVGHWEFKNGGHCKSSRKVKQIMVKKASLGGMRYSCGGLEIFDRSTCPDISCVYRWLFVLCFNTFSTVMSSTKRSIQLVIHQTCRTAIIIDKILFD